MMCLDENMSCHISVYAYLYYAYERKHIYKYSNVIVKYVLCSHAVCMYVCHEYCSVFTRGALLSILLFKDGHGNNDKILYTIIHIQIYIINDHSYINECNITHNSQTRFSCNTTRPHTQHTNNNTPLSIYIYGTSSSSFVAQSRCLLKLVTHCCVTPVDSHAIILLEPISAF